MSTSFPVRGMRVRFAGETHIGRKRQLNEDSMFLPDSDPMAVVADGMGGHASGEVASKLAVDTVSGYFHDTAEDTELTWPYKIDRVDRYEKNRLVVAVKLANQKIFEASNKLEGKAGMGTTIVAALFADDKVLLAHVGDSRAYRIRSGTIEQLTEDHSLLNDYLRMKKMTVEEAGHFQHKNVIVRALGMKDSVQVDVTTDMPRVDDIYLLCSDGLSGMLPDPELMEIATAEPDLDRACEKLIGAANEAGGNDNITVVLARIEAA